jgi:hypothetical protein
VATLVDRELGAGDHAVRWNAADAASGIYLCRLSAGEATATRRLMLVK